MSSSTLLVDQDDNMEVGTSPYAHNDDLDVDLLDNPEQSMEDNSMLDEAEDDVDFTQADNSATNQDDVMYEEDLLDFDDDLDMHAIDQDASATHVSADEQPLNVEVTEFTNSYEDPLPFPNTNLNELSDQPEIEPDLLDEEHEQDTDQEPATLNIVEEPGTSHEVTSSENTLPATVNNTTAYNTSIQDFAKPAHVDEVPVQADRPSHELSDTDDQADEDAVQLSKSLDPTEITAQNDDETSIPEDVAFPPLHTVMVEYDGQSFHMFPLPEDDTVDSMLHDSNLAYGPIENMLKQLHDSLGDYMGHDDEVVLDIPSLGLHICEDSRYSKELTLAQVIDTYMLLSQNQQLSEIEPLFCQLSHRVCLRTQMNYLVTSAREGKTYSTIVEEHVGSPELSHASAAEFADAEEPEYHNASDPAVALEAGSTDYHEILDGEEAQHFATNNGQNLSKESSSAVADPEIAAVTTSFDYHDEDDAALDGDDVAELIEETMNQSADHHTPKNGATALVNEVESDSAEVETSNDKDQHEEDEEEDLFADLESEPDLDTQDVIDLLDENTDHAAGDTAATNDPLNSEESREDNEHSITQDDEVLAQTITTPSKRTNGKRKLVEDEEESILDFSTPEPKRTKAA